MPKEEIVFGFGQSSLGAVLVASGEKGVVSILTGEDPEQLADILQQRFRRAHLIHEDRDCEHLVAQVVEAIDSPGRNLDLPLDVRGTAFQQRVWRVVRKIPMGQTSTYTEVARKIGAPKAIRAVGSACTNSQFSTAIPCHRVLHKNGSLASGAKWGDDRQRALLEREAAARAQTPPTSTPRRKKRRA